MAATEVHTYRAVEAHVRDLGARLRKADADEVRASSGREPLDVLLEALDKSDEAWSVFFDGELACMYGVLALRWEVYGQRTGIVWLVTSDLVERRPKAFWQACLDVLPALLDRWDELVNAIDVRHEKAIRWARRLGFLLADPEPFGASGLPFSRFRVTRGDLCVSR